MDGWWRGTLPNLRSGWHGILTGNAGHVHRGTSVQVLISEGADGSEGRNYQDAESDPQLGRYPTISLESTNRRQQTWRPARSNNSDHGTQYLQPWTTPASGHKHEPLNRRPHQDL